MRCGISIIPGKNFVYSLISYAGGHPTVKVQKTITFLSISLNGRSNTPKECTRVSNVLLRKRLSPSPTSPRSDHHHAVTLAPRSKEARKPHVRSNGSTTGYHSQKAWSANPPPTKKNHLLNKLCASHRSTLSSQPTLAAQPPAPNRHQSTPVANSVWRFISPNSTPERTGEVTGPAVGAGMLLPSDHTRTVMS